MNSKLILGTVQFGLDYGVNNTSGKPSKENIKKRGRDYEQNIDSKYLKSINAGYLDFHKTQTDLNIKIIDINNMDFVNNRIDYLSILKSICQ